MSLRYVQFDLAISAQDYQTLYAGWVRQVLVRARDGRKGAAALRYFSAVCGTPGSVWQL